MKEAISIIALIFVFGFFIMPADKDIALGIDRDYCSHVKDKSWKPFRPETDCYQFEEKENEQRAIKLDRGQDQKRGNINTKARSKRGASVITITD